MDIKAMMKQAQQMQKQMSKKQEELAKKEFVVEKQGVKIIIFGDKKIKKIDINEALVDPEDKELLEDLLLIAFNEAIDLIKQEEEKLSPQKIKGMF